MSAAEFIGVKTNRTYAIYEKALTQAKKMKGNFQIRDQISKNTFDKVGNPG